MDEYASRRFMLVCCSAIRFPTIIVSAAIRATSQTHSELAGSSPSANSRRKRAKAAALPPALRKAVMGKGAPW